MKETRRMRAQIFNYDIVGPNLTNFAGKNQPEILFDAQLDRFRSFRAATRNIIPQLRHLPVATDQLYGNENKHRNSHFHHQTRSRNQLQQPNETINLYSFFFSFFNTNLTPLPGARDQMNSAPQCDNRINRSHSIRSLEGEESKEESK